MGQATSGFYLQSRWIGQASVSDIDMTPFEEILLHCSLGGKQNLQELNSSGFYFHNGFILVH